MDLQIKNVVIVVEMENTNITLIEYFDINQLIPSGGASSCSKHCTPGERAVAVPQLYRLQPRNGLQRRVSRGRLGARRSTAAHRRPSPPAAADHRCLPPPTTAAQRLSPRRGPRADGGMYGSERHPSIPCASSAAHGMATPYCVRQSFGEIGEKETEPREGTKRPLRPRYAKLQFYPLPTSGTASSRVCGTIQSQPSDEGISTVRIWYRPPSRTVKNL
uniref:Uncharacterized protein n=1 Tax=Oryza nivara TaxID=4536 RepID=A0A0E0HRK0_ORYNI